MAGFDASLDKTINEEELQFDKTSVVVSVKCYNEGAKKLQLSRKNKGEDGGEARFCKLGRMTKEEALLVADKLKEFANAL